MPRQSKLQIAQEFIESLANMTPTPGSGDVNLAAVIASAKTNLELMAFSPEVAPTRVFVNASASGAQRHEDAMRRAKVLTGLDVNNDGMQLSRLCDMLEQAKAAPAAPAEEEGPRFTTPDHDLNELLELSVDLFTRGGNMDVGILWDKDLQAVLARLMPAEAVAGMRQIPAWLNLLDDALREQARTGRSTSRTATELQSLRAFLVTLLPMTGTRDRGGDPQGSVRGEGEDADILWFAALGPRQPVPQQTLLAAYSDGTVKETYGTVVLELIKAGLTTLTYWADMPPVPTEGCPAPWRPMTGAVLPERHSWVLAGYVDGAVHNAPGLHVRTVMLGMREKTAVSELRCWRPMPVAPGYVDVDQG